jgi:ribosome biogenesis protein Nip4
MLEHKLVLNQLHSEERGNESSKKEILTRINQWEKNMIERIHCKAEMARERLDQLTGNDEKEISKQAQELTKKIYEKNETEVRLEDDIEQLKQSIVHVKQALNKLARQSDVELYIEPSHMIDWNHLICVREKPVKTISSLISKTTIDKDSRDTKSSTTSNQRRKSTSYSNSESSSSSISTDDENDAQEMVSNETEFDIIIFSFPFRILAIILICSSANYQTRTLAAVYKQSQCLCQQKNKYHLHQHR